jgi:hypothetical protein
LAAEGRIGADEERAATQFDESCESGVDLAFGAGLQDMELHPLRARRIPHVSHDALGTCIVRVHEQGDHPGLGSQFGQQLEPSRVRFLEEGMPGQFGLVYFNDRCCRTFTKLRAVIVKARAIAIASALSLLRPDPFLPDRAREWPLCVQP